MAKDFYLFLEKTKVEELTTWNALKRKINERFTNGIEFSLQLQKLGKLVQNSAQTTAE